MLLHKSMEDNRYMNLFISIIKMEFITYKRNRLYLFAGTLFILYLLLGWYHFLRGDYIEAGVMLQATTYINMSATLLGLFSGIMANRRDETAHFQEVLISLPGDGIRPIGKIFALGIVSIIFTLAGYFAVLILFMIPCSEYLMFKKEILTYIIIYWSIPFISCGMIGYFLEVVIPSNKLLIPLTLLLWLIISPFNIILRTLLPEKMLLLLNVGENNAHAIYDEYSGLHISTDFIKNASMFFLISLFLFIGGILYKKRDEIKNVQKYVIIFAMLIILFTTYSLFNSINGIEYDRDDIYYFKPLDNLIRKSENKEPSIKLCDMEICFKKNEIRYIAHEYIINIYDRTVTFTLYHGLEIISVKIEGYDIAFKREGDLLYLVFPEGIEQGLITFEVEGNTGDYFHLSEHSVYLSSTFPWYPVPGTFIIAEKGLPYEQVEFKNVELKEPIEFRVKIMGAGRFYSNLEEISKNEFQGFQKGVSLLKGMLISKNIEGKEYIVPPDRINLLISKMHGIEEKINYISDVIGRPPKKIPDKIFVKPLHSSFHQYNYIFAEDHLSVSLGRYIALVDIKGVFRTFYWNDIYRNADNSHAYIFEIILEYMEEPENAHNYIDIFAKDDSDSYTFLKELSVEIIGLHELDPEYLNELLKYMYNEIENNSELPLNHWLNIIVEIKERG